MKLEMDDDRESRGYLLCLKVLAAAIIGLDSPEHAARSKQDFLNQLDFFIHQGLEIEDADPEIVWQWREMVHEAIRKFGETGNKMFKWN